MQKNDKCYTFLLSHRSKNNSRIYIKHVEVSKRFLHFGCLALFFALGISTLGLGILGMDQAKVFATNISTVPAGAQLAAAPAKEINQNPADAYAFNSGGPEESEEQAAGENGENNEVEAQIGAIRSNIDPSYMPSIWPHSGKINNEFGFRRNPFGGRAYEFHPGMDIDGERGESVLAPASGTVIKAGFTGGYGNMVEISHGDGLTTRYGHLSKIDVSVGSQVTRGQLIGYIGSTGRSTGPHLHYELRLNDKSINPRHVLPPESPDLSIK